MIRASSMVLLVWLIACLPPRAAGDEDVHVGWVQRIDANCQARWRAYGKADEQTLDPIKDHYRFLYQGEALRCAGSGLMVVQIYDLPPQEIRKRNGPCTIGAAGLSCEDQKARQQSSAETPGKKTVRIVNQQALGAFGRPAGRKRGFRAVIYCPTEDSVVRAEKVVIRWNTPINTSPVELRLMDKYNGLLWREKQVQRSAGQLVSEEVRRTLKAYRDEGRAGPLTVTLTSGDTDPSATHFSLLSAADEVALEQELRACDQERDLRRAICRTYACTRRQMWNEAAEEHDAALQLEPRSQSLILAAIAAHRGIGNSKRVAELVAELPPGTTVPD
jgi:hypothetical protein